MTVRTTVAAVAISILATVIMPIAPGAEPVDSLRGISGVYLNVLPTNKDAAAAGLSEAHIRRIVKDRLRKAKIPIHKRPSPKDGRANLIVKIDTLKHPQGVYLFTVEVSLIQEVHLARLKSADLFPSETWSKQALGLTTPNQMDLIHHPVLEKVDEFIADYRKANPR